MTFNVKHEATVRRDRPRPVATNKHDLYKKTMYGLHISLMEALTFWIFCWLVLAKKSSGTKQQMLFEHFGFVQINLHTYIRFVVQVVLTSHVSVGFGKQIVRGEQKRWNALEMQSENNSAFY